MEGLNNVKSSLSYDLLALHVKSIESVDDEIKSGEINADSDIIYDIMRYAFFDSEFAQAADRYCTLLFLIDRRHAHKMLLEAQDTMSARIAKYTSSKAAAKRK